MNQKEIDAYTDKLVQWYEEGATIVAQVGEDDSFEIEIDNNGIKTYQEFNFYQGSKVWSLYNEKLSRNN